MILQNENMRPNTFKFGFHGALISIFAHLSNSNRRLILNGKAVSLMLLRSSERHKRLFAKRKGGPEDRLSTISIDLSAYLRLPMNCSKNMKRLMKSR